MPHNTARERKNGQAPARGCAGAWNLGRAGRLLTGQRGRVILVAPVAAALPLPGRKWGTARYGSLMAYSSAGGSAISLRAEPEAAQPESADPDDLTTLLRSHPLSFCLTASRSGGIEHPIAVLLLTEPEIGATPIYFDPVRNHPVEIELLPRAVASVREWAYAGSFHGRGECSAVAARGSCRSTPDYYIR